MSVIKAARPANRKARKSHTRIPSARTEAAEATSTDFTTQARPVVNIDPAHIVSRDRLRKFRPAAVEALAGSIKAQGQLQPILVQRCGADFVLITGRHRLQAVRKLGHDTIRAEIAENLDADQALLIEIDENLVRADLSPAERVLRLVSAFATITCTGLLVAQ
jgi:ParB/RepB/Spo0J family partition protein